MDHTIREFDDGDISRVLEIFNHYILKGFSAYPERPLEKSHFPLLAEMTRGYPFLVLVDPAKNVVGFAFLHAHNRMPAFRFAAEVTYFIEAGHTGKGLGRLLLDGLIERGRAMGLRTLIASISSRNDHSIAFHLKNGFVQAGLLRGVGVKFDQPFDEFLMQRDI